MKYDRLGRTPGEIRDEARQCYAVGTVRLRAIADDLSEIALKGDGTSRLELKLLHAGLSDVYELLGRSTVFGMGNEAAEPAAATAYRDAYSDGTPVSIAVGPPSSRGWSAPSDAYDCYIPWLPNTSGNDGYVGDGPTPPGCAVIVVDPPHWRRSKARARTTP
jgi:hypothetical protein